MRAKPRGIGGVEFEAGYPTCRTNLQLRTAIDWCWANFNAPPFPSCVQAAACWELYLKPGNRHMRVTCIIVSIRTRWNLSRRHGDHLGSSSGCQTALDRASKRACSQMVMSSVHDQCTISLDTSEAAARRGPSGTARLPS